jgi:diguanylate cyclase (GGDEF)-like protein/PAS domain S-box-containing protein
METLRWIVKHHKLTLVGIAFGTGLALLEIVTQFDFLQSLSIALGRYRHYSGDEWLVVLLFVGLGLLFNTHYNQRYRESNLKRELQQSEANLHALFNNTLQDMILLDLEGKVVAINKRAKSTTRTFFGAVLTVGESLYDFLPPQYRENAQDSFKRACQGELVTAERQITAYDNRAEYWIELNYIPAYDHTRQVVGVCFAALDITARKQAEEKLARHSRQLKLLVTQRTNMLELANRQLQQEIVKHSHTEAALRESQDRYQALFEDSPISLWEEDFSQVKAYFDRLRAEGVTELRAYFEAHPDAALHCAGLVKIVDINQATLCLYQAGSKAELLGSLGQIFDPGALLVFKEELLALAAGQGRFQGEIVGHTLDGSSLHLALQLSVAPGYENTWERVLVSIMDITERRRMEEALRESETRFRGAFEYAAFGMALIGPAGNFLQVNRFMCQMLGYSEQELLTKTCQELTHPDDLQAGIELAQNLMAGQQDFGWLEKRYLHKNGTVIWALLSTSLIRNAQGKPAYMVSQVQNITERRRMEKALQQSEQRYALVVRATSDGLWDWELQTNSLYLSPRWKLMLGYAEHEIGNRPHDWFDLVHPEDRASLQAVIAAHLGGVMDHFEYEYRIQHKEGDYRWVLSRGLAVRDRAGYPCRFAGSQSDITDRKRMEEQLLHDAFHSRLSGLPNRTLFLNHVARSLGHAQRQGTYQFAVLFLDLDRFKMVNEGLGHQAGDQFLLEVAHRLEQCVRPGDVLAHIGSDEFAILLDGINTVQEAAELAHHIQAQLAPPIFPCGKNSDQAAVTASIGIALSGEDYHQAEDILRDAETAMYQAKSRGLARYEIFRSGSRANLIARLRLENELRRAVEQHEFQPHYQPIISLTTGQITAVETLLRWCHPRQGLVLPGEFIPLAEELGLIIPISEWLLRTACRQAASWHQAGHTSLRLAVNISAYQFETYDLLSLIETVLAETEFDPHSLELEITETIAMSNTNGQAKQLEKLSKLGVHLSIDDFGTGHSSLSRLKALPVNTLKIDRSFVENIASDPGNQAIITAIIAMSHSLGLKVIAEGVETETQLAFLQAQRCDEVQGYLFSRPLGADKIPPLLRELSSNSET